MKDRMFGSVHVTLPRQACLYNSSKMERICIIFPVDLTNRLG